MHWSRVHVSCDVADVAIMVLMAMSNSFLFIGFGGYMSVVSRFF